MISASEASQLNQQYAESVIATRISQSIEAAAKKGEKYTLVDPRIVNRDIARLLEDKGFNVVYESSGFGAFASYYYKISWK